MSDCWTSVEDINNDLFAVSDFCSDKSVKPITQPSVTERRARAKPSLYDFDNLEEEQYVPHIRGRPVLNEQNIVRPGGIPSFLRHQHETSKEIRQVCSIGYSNEIIEHCLRGDYETNIERMPHIELNDLSSNKSSANTSPANVVVKSSSDSSSNNSSPAKKKVNADFTTLNNNQRSQVRNASEEPVMNGIRNTNESTPGMPIYDLLKANMRNKKQNRNAFKGKLEPEKLDINSKVQFPDLA